jgi:DNA-directed RNA polymerase specialized sigma24 family protein
MTSEPAHPTTNTPGDTFATTHWTAVLAAGQQKTPESDAALEELCRTYWFPLYAYVRRRAHSKEDAEDLTQGFFARFLEKNYLAGLSAQRGRFRAFLLAALKHFLANEGDKAKCFKRGGQAPLLPNSPGEECLARVLTDAQTSSRSRVNGVEYGSGCC